MTKRISVPKNLATPHPISEEGKASIAAALNPLVADAIALYIKTKSFHWHASGNGFRDIHLLFDEQADQVFGMIDSLAERIRKLGGVAIRSVGEVASFQRIQDDAGPLREVKEMLLALLADNQAFAGYLREAHKVCGQYGDVATCSILEVFLDEAERRCWFLFESSR